MKRFLKIASFSFCLLLIVIPSLFLVSADEQSDRLNALSQQIQDYQNKLKDLGNQSNTLANQIAQFNAQIRITELKIEQTQDQIDLLSGRIDLLEGSLDSLTNAFNARVVETYKLGRVEEPILVLLTSPNLKDAVTRYHYLQKLESADKNLLTRLKTAQDNYKKDKSDFEALNKTLEDQKSALDQQKLAKNQLLIATKNNEAKYQQLLSAAQSEYQAIQAILAGRGSETEVGHVSEGAKIASIIQGPSCNSSGSHTHFIVSQNGQTQNPFNYLKSGIDYTNNSGSSPGSGDGDPFNPNGSWNWPISPKIIYWQGYGVTWAIKNTWVKTIYSFHNGIDINSDSSSDIKAVKSGQLFQGSYAGSNCNLRYVRVHHDDGGLDTFYLHVNY